MKQMQNLRLLGLNGIHLEYHQGLALKTSTIGCPFDIFSFINGEILLERFFVFGPHFISYIFTNLIRFCLIIHVQCMTTM